MADVKGVIVNGWSHFLLSEFGAEAVEKARAAMPADEGALIKKTFLDSLWYPYDTMAALRHLTRTLAGNRVGTATDIGVYLADFAFKGAYESAMTREPSRLVRNFSWMQKLFYRDARQLEAHMSGPSSAVMTCRYADGVRPTRSVCQSLIGFYGRALELSTGAKVQGTHAACVCDGAPQCEFAFAW